MRRWLSLAVWLVWSGFGAQNSHAAAPDAALRRIIDCMPEDVETVVVARGSLRLPKQVAGPGVLTSPAATSVPAPVFWSAAALPIDYVSRCAPGETLRLAMGARRHFRAPAGLGLMRYEGCTVFRLAPTPRTTQTHLSANILKSAKTRIRIGATDVGVYARRMEQDNWTFYVCSPAANEVLVATDRAFLKTVLARRTHSAPAGKRALPNVWSGWTGLNSAASFWAVRRLGPGFGPLLVSKPDPGAQSLTASLSKEQVIWRYDGQSLKEMAQIRAAFEREAKLPTTTRILPGGFQECHVDLRGASENQTGYFGFYLLGFLDPAIFL